MFAVSVCDFCDFIWMEIYISWVSMLWGWDISLTV